MSAATPDLLDESGPAARGSRTAGRPAGACMARSAAAANVGRTMEPVKAPPPQREPAR